MTRLVVGFMVVTVTFSGAWLWTLYGPLTRATLEQQQRNLTAVARSAALVASQSDTPVTQLTSQLVARTDLRMTIVAADGRVLADSDNDPATMGNHRNRPEIAEALAGRTGVSRRVSATERVEQLYVAVPGSIGGERVALRVSQPLSEIERIASNSRRAGLALLVVAIAASAVVARWAVRAASRPVQDLVGAAEKMAAGNLRTDVPRVPADLAGLASSLDSLQREIQQRISSLESGQTQLRTTLDSLQDAVLVLSDHRIAFANRCADELFVRPAAGWEGTDLSEAGLPAPVVGAIEDRLAAPDTVPVDIETDPTGRTLRLSVAPLLGDVGERSIAVISDVTDVARLEAVRRDFVANASHELKTPVAGIRLLAESAEMAAADGDSQQALAFTRQIEAESKRLQQLVTDLLDLSRLEGAVSAEAITDVRSAISRAITSHAAHAARKGLELRTDDTAVRSESVFVHAEDTDVAVALDNLIDNAIAYTETGSVTVGLSADARSVHISVSDTGPGIASEHQARVFERFYRIDRGRTRAAGGTGLGLALVRHVAARAGGEVRLESTPGEGSTFTLSLPRAR